MTAGHCVEQSAPRTAMEVLALASFREVLIVRFVRYFESCIEGITDSPMASSSPPVPSLAFVSAATTTARVVRARLEKRYGAVKPAQADIIVALGGDGLMLQTLHRNMRRGTPIYRMHLGTVGPPMNTYKEAGLLQRLTKARHARLPPLPILPITTPAPASQL